MSVAGDGIGTGAGARPRPAAARFRARAGGIEAVEAFSRGDALDRDWMGWGVLRVLSRQDWAPGAARDDGRVANMERLLLVLEGALEADCGDLGRHRIDAGSALWIGAGHGLSARLANASATAPLRLVELWLRPDRVNAAPAVTVGGAEASSTAVGAGAAWTAVAAGEADADADADTVAFADAMAGDGHVEVRVLPLRQRASAMRARLTPGQALALPSIHGARYWLEVLEGEVATVVSTGTGTGADADAAADAAALAAAGPAMRLGAGDGLGWRIGDAGAPVSIVGSGTGPAHVLLLALPD